MPTAKKLPSGSWRCQVFSHIEEITQADGSVKKKRIYKSFTHSDSTAKGKRKCEAMAAEWAAEKETRKHECVLTFKEALGEYIEKRSSILSPSTIREYKRCLHRGLDSLKNIKLCDITQEKVQEAVNIEALTHSPKTVRNLHGLLSAVLAVYRPDFALHTALPKKIRPQLYIPTESEIKAVLDYVSRTDEEMEIAIYLAAFGPMRRGEIAALTSDDIQGNVVHVCHNMVKASDNSWVIKTPKSYAGDRFIDFPDFVIEKLQTRKGKIISLNPAMITNRFEDILKRADVQHFRFHDLRHYSASIQHALKIPDSYIMQRGGWGSDTVLKSVYRHTLEEKNQEMNQIANDYFTDLCNTKCNTKK